MNDPDTREKQESAGQESGSVVRHEEELQLGTEVREFGAVRVGKRVEGEPVREVVPRSIEHFDDVERTRPNERDSGEVEVLPDGSVSIPIFEEELVVSKRTVVRERVIVRKRMETRDERVEAELRKEKVQVDADAGVEVAEGELIGEAE
jgi:uncharacterized protein (TIGR02271 family)